MESKAKLLGHPVHPVLVVFPLGLLITSLIFDLIRIASGNPQWSQASYYMIAAGIIGGLLAAIPGLIDWLAIPRGTRASAVATWHGLGNVLVLLLFGASWLLRSAAPGDPGAAALLLSFMGVGLGAITGWLGGELVDRLGVGVDEGAHLNAPNSLSARAVRPSGGGHDVGRAA